MDWKLMVSIICNTYNHEKYIRDALDGFLMQKTNFKFEVLIHDDASTDNTSDIIREYQKDYPEIIKPIYQSENMYSRGIRITDTYQYPRAKGKYIAFCEGDDFWIDPYKLQKQVDAMELHPEIDICAHAAVKVDANRKKIIQNIAPLNDNAIISVEDVIFGEGGFVATNTLLHRADMNERLLKFRKNWVIDYTLQIQGALRGGMLYISDYMSAYRWLSDGSWTSKQQSSIEKRTELLSRKQVMLDQLNKDTQGLYSTCIEKRKNRNIFEFYYKEKNYKLAFSKDGRKGFETYAMAEKIKLILKAIFPFLNGITVRIKNKKYNPKI